MIFSFLGGGLGGALTLRRQYFNIFSLKGSDNSKRDANSASLKDAVGNFSQGLSLMAWTWDFACLLLG